ncbi:MAG: prepilin-type N-terminal cleavage/methylation domain-containing protein [Candidatus Sumerlaeia bacterium]|nr:prepilin-type N-terminal cleavage/methylation domain-containing protein [Candidatus Sumerlaeia bacterium]
MAVVARNRFGFTLIELLIVVAIIAILAAIAVPNFLEAQVRSKVSRVKSDLRTLSNALETYAVDNNAYPLTVSFFEPLPSRRFVPLTTPIAYISSVPRDPFDRRTEGNFESLVKSIDPSEPLNLYMYNLGTNTAALPGGDPNVLSRQYSLTSSGPDGVLEFPYYAFTPNFVQTRAYLQYIYDPTNGTVSRGEIFRRGGYKPDAIPGLP